MTDRQPTPENIGAVLAGLHSTPVRIAAILEVLTRPELALSPAGGGWSIHEILRHLRACQAVYGGTIYHALLLESPQLPEVHPRDWMRLHKKSPLHIQEALSHFQSGRRELIRVLEGLSPEDWERTARTGDRLRTVYGEARRIARHEAGHCEELDRIAGAFE